MKLKFITDFEQIKDQQGQWDAVAGSFPFSRWSWMANWYQYLGEDLQLAILVATDDDGNWTGIAPWCIDELSSFTRRLRLLGSGAACSDYLDLICNPENYREFSEACTDWLVANIGNPATLGKIDAIELEGITPNSPQTKYLCDLFQAHGLQSHATDLEGGWEVELPSQWSELNSCFSKSMRRKTKKAVQRLKAPETEIVAAKVGDFDELWPVFTELHQQRRKMLGQSGCFADQNFEAFLRQATKSLLHEGIAQLRFIYREGKPLASMLLFNDQRTVYMYQSGMDSERLKLEPGYQIGTSAIQSAIEDGFSKFDFLRGDEPYKARWNTTRIPILRTRFIPRNSFAKIKHGIWLTGRSLKHLAGDASGVWNRNSKTETNQ
ncbi:MAG: GNAT family N-acetyltransferase [Mariniblastus sp.]